MSFNLPSMQSRIDEIWPQVDLEEVDKCPFCGAKERNLANDEVGDWTFYNAPGRWCYSRCKSCEAKYLNPRPTPDSIGRAYSAYYTHGSIPQSSLHRLKVRIRNEYLSHLLTVNLLPRLFLPSRLRWLLLPLKRVIVQDFGLSVLSKPVKGKVVDVGCGDGKMLQIAEQMGWNAMGLELDPGAVQSGRKLGLRVLHGSYEILNNYPSTFDCIIFSHVLEHLHNPIEALRSIKNALKIGGILLISCPNATSIVGEYFGRYWRGLEAPRHLAIPSLNFLRDYLTGMGFSVEQHLPIRFPTIKSSMEIMINNSSASYKQINASLKVRNRLVVSSPEQADFIEFVCIKKLH